MNLAAWLVLLTAAGLVIVNITAILNALTLPRLGKWKHDAHLDYAKFARPFGTHPGA